MRREPPRPAQLMQMRAIPCASRALANAATALSSLVTSHSTASAPISFAVFSASSTLRSNSATLAPASTSLIAVARPRPEAPPVTTAAMPFGSMRSEEHTSELPVTNAHLVCRLLLEKKNNNTSHSLTVLHHTIQHCYTSHI